MTENELAKPEDVAGFNSLTPQDQRDLKQDVYIPNLTFVTGTSDVAKANPPLAHQGQYFGHNTALTDPVIFVCHVRRHAIFFKNKEKIAESFNPKSPIYQDIKADVPNYDFNKGYCPRECLSFLVYVPALGDFCILYPASKTQRSVAGDIIKYTTPIKDRDSDASKELGVAHLFKLGNTQLTNKFKTLIPTATPLFEPPEDYASPGEDALARAVKIFLRPVIAELENPVEEAPESEDER